MAAPVTPDDAGSVAGIVARLAIWARNAPKGLARVEYDSGHSLKRAVDESRTVLAEHAVPFHEIALPVERDPAELVRSLVARLRGLPPHGVVSITGWATAFSREVALADALRLLNANRENVAQFELCQVWWLTRSFTDALRHVAPDLDSWFVLKLDLREATALDSLLDALDGPKLGTVVGGALGGALGAVFMGPVGAAVGATIGEAMGRSVDDAKRRAARFEHALSASSDHDEVRDIAWRAVATLFAADDLEEGAKLARRFNDAVRARGLADVVPPPLDGAALERLTRGIDAASSGLDGCAIRERFARFCGQHAEAANLLRCAVMFGPEPIPEELLDFAMFAVSRPGAPGMLSWSERQRLLRELAEGDLIRHDAASQSYLVPQHARTTIRNLYGGFHDRAVQAVTLALSHFALVIPVLQQRLWPHVRACVALASFASVGPLRELAQALTRHAERLHEAQRHEDALPCHEEAVALLRALDERQPADFALELARALDAQSVAYRVMQRWNDAIASAREAVEHCRRLDERADGVRACLAAALDNLSVALGAVDRHAEALAAAEEAVGHHRVLAQRKTGATRAALAASLAHLASTLGALGRPVEAEQAAEEARALSLAPRTPLTT